MSDMQGDALWQAEGGQKRSVVQRMFAEIAPSYDLLNGLMSVSLHHRWRKRAVEMLQLKPGNRALDVCCGTGDFMVPLQRAVGSQGFVAGVDFCLPMLDIARHKVEDRSLALGDAGQLPIATESFDAVSVGWGIRNVPDIDGAHRELARVLRSGGRFVSLDMARPRNPVVRALSEFLFMVCVPRLGALFGKTNAYTYLPKSTQRFWSREQLLESMTQSGFVNVGCQDLMLGNICIHWGQKK